ncbi:hypothetical protein Bpfe_026663 [Biomphalaria pfeifferi]|uniref:Uncharacterized protein n=1 Tax=Biomphalaria pfeifferi TaxID=112525 RepID=A0AAD8AWS0_BIOPF|nr:hypothetical protein Bpfe_026663 [Biomphalaria pfeifferi]
MLKTAFLKQDALYNLPKTGCLIRDACYSLPKTDEEASPGLTSSCVGHMKRRHQGLPHPCWTYEEASPGLTSSCVGLMKRRHQG